MARRVIQKEQSVSLLGLLAATASFPFSLRLTSGRRFQKHPVSAMLQTFSGCHPLIRSLDRSFQLSSLHGLTSASSPATVIVEMLCALLKRSNHPLEARKPSTCSFSAITKTSSWSIVPDTGVLEDLQRQYHCQTASLTSAYLPDLFFSYATRISCFSFMMVCIWVLPTPNFLASFL